MSKKFGTVKTGVIGVGSMGKNHARVFNEISNLVGISDLNEEVGIAIANKYESKYYKDYNELLEKVDAVVVAVPTKHHLEISSAVALSGTHLLVEKPMAESVSSAKEIINTCKSNNVVLSVGHIERHNPVVSVIKTSFERGDWGRLLMQSSKRLSRFPERIKDVGVIFDLAIHDIDIMNYIANSNLESLKCIAGRSEHKKFEDHAALILKYENGIKASSEVSWITPSKVRNLSLTCDNAFVSVDYFHQTVKVYRKMPDKFTEIPPVIESSESDFEELPISKSEPLMNQLIDFLKCVDSRLNPSLKNQEPLVSGEDGLKALEIAEMAINQIQ